MNYLKGIAIGAMTAATLGAAPAMAQEVFVQAGTQGGGVGAALGLTSWAGLHTDIDGFNVTHNFHAGDNEFHGTLHVRHAGLYLDLFPFAGSGFRVTTGAMFDRDRLEGDAVAENGYYSLDGTKIPAALLAGQTVSVKARFPTVMPYLGIGFGHKPVSKGLGFVADIGVAYGRPRVDFSGSETLALLGGSAVTEEEDKIRDSIQRYRIYPVVQIGVSYRF
ncbi:MAG: hypothetical protein ACRYHA_06420 [Janthinobacterium lividum]